ncbi:glycosyltransferase family 2 protein [bacterium]|nr:glycosyltransferase family 2 protein [candidate division CSSED10-310 bacterium]
MDLSIVIPAFNEEHDIESCVTSIISYLEGEKLQFEILAIDDGSTDHTLEQIRKLSARDPRIRALTNGSNHGKGYTVRHGMLESTGQEVLFTDVDLSTPIREYLKLKEFLDQGADVAFGSRALAKSQLKKKQPWYRIYLGRLANKAIQAVVPALRGIKDTQCGFKLFRGEVARRIFPLQRIERWGFDFEILHIARKYGYKVVEVPVEWSHSGDTRIRFRDYPRTLQELIRVRIAESRGLYDEPETIGSKSAH